ncbi:sigma-70 family RNA polymerase sigma factor [Clostridium ganghwense]|uniref:Sigma-70 family RNA polymerase sigma factor n=1 Tax=Clostridium ganghwense TaxID=312089 RepID=A0ABT4CLT8_9CLOT|nr:sigma-70 family RNA polymerase sigma factor [Clostridium ganghwense]MCY6369433.1 sigma-70 family RNA polymerase sigma factor [Clostridium ganghwense]
MERGERVDSRKLVEKAKQGDGEALIQLIMDKNQEYYKLAYVYMKNEEDALDVMEDMIVILYENIHKLKKDDAFYSWSKTILVNCCKKLLRKRKKVVSLESIKEEADEEIIEQKNKKIMLDGYLSKLNEKHQEVIKLRYFLDLDYQTIASLIKVPIGTVKSRISIGLKKLKESFGGEEL